MGRGFGGGCNFLRGLILGVNFEKEQNVRGSKYEDKGLAFYVKVVKLLVLCQQQNVTRTKLGPETYQLNLLPGM